MISHKRLLGSLTALLLVSAFAQSAGAALLLSLRAPGGTTVAAGAPVPLELWLSGNRTSVVASIELQILAAPGGASFVTQSPTTDGFAESTAVQTYLGTANGSLLGDRFLGFAAGPGVDGLPIGGDDIRLGTLWLATPAGVASNYPVGIDGVSVDVLDSSISSIPSTASGITLTTVVPEPAGLLALAACLFSLALARRRSATRIDLENELC